MPKARVRRGWTLRTSSQRRSVRKRSGLSARQYKKVVKSRRRYKKGK